MRVMLRQYSRNSCRSLTLGLMAVTAVTLVGCQNDVTKPSDEQPIAPVTAFTLTEEAAKAADAATVVGMHELRTVPLRNLSAAGFSADAGPTINSPFDLTFFGGPVLTQSTSYNVYINCESTAAQCWGSGSLSPGTFLRDLNQSNFIRLVNEYTGSDARGRFPVQELSTTKTFTNNGNGVPTASRNDIFQIIFSAANFTGVAGYNAVYHVFLPQGTDMCRSPTVCYSPDDPANWIFCAFHGSVTFGTSGGPLHILYSVEPYQDLPGCVIEGQDPHGAIDATASTLSHELIETITDPDLNAWFNGLFGMEIADICSAFGTNQRLSGHNYVLQSEYSNKLRNCTNQAPSHS
jgi:hypothetical protein